MNTVQSVAFKMLEERIHHARKKHPVFAASNDEALDVILDEAEELSNAIHHEGPARVIDEALDVAATAMRLVMGEVQG